MYNEPTPLSIVLVTHPQPYLPFACTGGQGMETMIMSGNWEATDLCAVAHEIQAKAFPVMSTLVLEDDLLYPNLKTHYAQNLAQCLSHRRHSLKN